MYSSASDAPQIKTSSSAVSPRVIFGYKVKMPGTCRPASRCSRKCTGIDSRLLVTSEKPRSSHQSRISWSGVLNGGVIGSPTRHTTMSGANCLSALRRINVLVQQVLNLVHADCISVCSAALSAALMRRSLSIAGVGVRACFSRIRRPCSNHLAR